MADSEKNNTTNIIYYGRFPQYNENHADPIEWIILEKNSETMLLISRYALITTGYCDTEKAFQDLRFLEWQNSLAREVCMQFYKTAFSSKEKETLVQRQFSDNKTNISDYVFLLSEVEVLELMSDANLRKAKPTPYALEKGARLGWTDDSRDCSSWWLMPEEESRACYSVNGVNYNKMYYPKAVFENGHIQFHGRNIYHKDFTIRPCILINVEKYLSTLREK